MGNYRGSKLKKKREKRKKKRISHLPDELWRKILDLGIKNSKFTYKDLCCISITCKRLHHLSDEDSVWNLLVSSDFPYTFLPFFSAYRSRIINNYLSSSPSSSSAKSYYKIRIERMREIERDEEPLMFAFRSCKFYWFTDLFREIEEQRRAEIDTFAAVLSKIQEIELTEQKEKRKPTVAEYFNLPKENYNGYECVPDRRFPREKRSKVSTRQWKCWYQ